MSANRYYDLFINPHENIIKILLLAKHLGYCGIGIDLGEKISDHIGSNVLYRIEEKAKEIGIQLILRANINEVKKLPEEIQKKFQIIYVNVINDNDVRNALRNDYINLISCDFTNFNHILSPEILNLIKQFHNKFVEIRLLSFLKQTPIEKAQTLSIFYRKRALYNKPDLPFIISSCAQKLEDFLSPRCIRSFLRVIGLREEVILNYLSYNPEKLIKMPWKVILLKSD